MRGSWVVCGWVALAGLAGCGSASAPSPPTGVDELTIPTSSPSAADFVGTRDNPWLPLDAGLRATYDDSTSAWVVGTAPHAEVGDIPLTEVARAVPGERAVVDWFAQDRAGNVWWFGRDGDMFAEPGLAMPAEPRMGDGFVMADAPGVEVRAEVTAVDETVTVPAGEFDDVVVLAVHEADGSRQEYYAPGVGLVYAVESGGAGQATETERELVDIDEPPS